jgi:hypothetical protein
MGDGPGYGDDLVIWLLRSDKQRTVGMMCIWDSVLIGLKIYLVVRDFLWPVSLLRDIDGMMITDTIPMAVKPSGMRRRKHE